MRIRVSVIGLLAWIRIETPEHSTPDERYMHCCSFVGVPTAQLYVRFNPLVYQLELKNSMHSYVGTSHV